MYLFAKKLFKELVIILTLVYLCLIAIGITYSDNLIFLPPSPTYSWSNDLISIKSKNVSTADDNTIIARYLKNPDANYTILYSHGNAVDIGGLSYLLKNFYQHGYSIIIYDYSGYGLSNGQPSEQQAYSDVAAVYTYLTQYEKLKPKQIISFGHSLGTAIATDLAFKKPVAGLILESPFTTAFRVKTVYSLLPFDKFSSIDKIDKVHTPIFITHSKDDAIVPFWHGKELFEKAEQPKKALWLNQEGHVNITHNASFWTALNAFIYDNIMPANNSL